MPASLDKLPDELLKLIIDHVDAADRSWRALGLEQGAVVPRPPEQQTEGEAADDTGTDVVKGRWASWYGRGVFALAHVDKRWNELARAILFKVRSLPCPRPPPRSSSLSPRLTRLSAQSVKWDRIATPFFQLFVLGELLGDYIKEIDLDLGGPGVPCLPIACALRKLPKLDKLHLNLGVNQFKDYIRPSDDVGHLESCAVAALGRISSLQLSYVNGPQFAYNLYHVDSERLRTLSIWVQPPREVQHLSDVLERFDALREVTLIVPRLHMAYVDFLRPPSSVTRLETKAAMSFEDGLRFAARFAPQVEILTLVCTSPTRAGDLVDASKPLDGIVLPRLRRLVLEGASTSFGTYLLANVFPRLEAYHVALAPPTNPPPSNQIQDTLSPSARLPPSLREVVIEMSSSFSDAVLTSLCALNAACDRHGIAYRTRWPFARAQAHTTVLDAPPAVVSSRASQVCETLSWATERTRWLGELGDLPGLDEMAAAVGRLRERRAIERS